MRLSELPVYGGPQEIEYLTVFRTDGQIDYDFEPGELLQIPFGFSAVSYGRPITVPAYLLYRVSESGGFADFVQVSFTENNEATLVNTWKSGPGR